jgi:oxygen-independent coproporphyrinogen III oxidase
MHSSDVSIDLLNKYNIGVPRYTSYPTAPEWQDKLSQEDYSKKVKTLTSQQGIALYVHIPFCEKLCWYCGCNTIIKKQNSHADKYLKFLLQEIEQVSQLIPEKVKVSQLHWGGGSPNFLSEKQTIILLDKIDECFDVDYDGEVAVEIDPRTTENEQIELYRRLGFNRISMGIQSFDAKVQKAINRIQPYERIAELVQLCKSLDFKSINFDLIYGLPQQTLESFNATLHKTKELSPDRIALYSFACLPEVIAHHKLIQQEQLPEVTEKFQLFLNAREFLSQNGYCDIAMDHFAKENDELTIAYRNKKLHRNFMGYTVQNVRDSLGFGLSSISTIDNTYIQNKKNLNDYYADLENYEYPIANAKNLNSDDLMRQWIINKLMCTLEVSYSEFQQKFDGIFEDLFCAEIGNLKSFVDSGFLKLLHDKIEITSKGSLFMRNICSQFDVYYARNKQRFSKAI